MSDALACINVNANAEKAESNRTSDRSRTASFARPATPQTPRHGGRIRGARSGRLASVGGAYILALYYLLVWRGFRQRNGGSFLPPPGRRWQPLGDPRVVLPIAAQN